MINKLQGPGVKPAFPFMLNKDSPQARGLIGWWPGEPFGGNKVYDLSGYGNHLNFTLGAAATVVSIPANEGGVCPKFSLHTWASLPSSNVFGTPGVDWNTPFSMSVWTKAAAISQTAILLGKYDGFEGFYFRETGANYGVFLVQNGGSNFAEVTVPRKNDLLWQLVIMTYDGSGSALNGLKLYVNGTLPLQSIVSDTLAGSWSSNTAAFQMSGDNGNTSNLNGSIEDARFYSRVLPPAECRAMYDPATRWDLRYVPGRKVYSFGVPGVAYDAVSNSGYQAAASSLSWSHIWNGNNRMLSIDVAMLSVTDTVTAMTYGGATCTFVGAQNVVGGTGRIETWRILQSDAGAPAAGSNTISVTISGSLACAGSAVSYKNVHQTTPTEGFNGNSGINAGSGTNATVAVTTTANNDWVHAALATNQASGIASSQTSRNVVAGTLGTGADSDTGPLAPTTQTMTFTGEGITAAWAIAGYAIRPTTASGGPTNYTRSLSDTPSTTDSIARAQVLARALSDSPLTSDTIARAQTLGRSLSDTPSTIDSITRAEVLGRTLTDSPVTIDSVARAEVLARSLTDSPVTSDSLVRSEILARALSDLPATTDSIVRAETLGRTLSDAPATTDSLARSIIMARSISDSPSTIDSVVRRQSIVRAISDSPLTSDSITRSLVLARALTDSPLTSDSLARSQVLVRAMSDSPLTTDSLTRTQTINRSITDSPSTADSIARTEVLARSLTDSPSTADSLIRLQHLARSMADSPSTADSIVAAKVTARTLSDSPVTSDSIARSTSIVRSLSDSPVTTDSVTRMFVGARTLTDSFFTADVISIFTVRSPVFIIIGTGSVGLVATGLDEVGTIATSLLQTGLVAVGADQTGLVAIGQGQVGVIADQKTSAFWPIIMGQSVWGTFW